METLAIGRLGCSSQLSRRTPRSDSLRALPLSQATVLLVYNTVIASGSQPRALQTFPQTLAGLPIGESFAHRRVLRTTRGNLQLQVRAEQAVFGELPAHAVAVSRKRRVLLVQSRC